MLSSSNDPSYREVLYGENYAEDLRYQHFWRTGSGTWYAPDGSMLDEYLVTSITINKFSQFLANSTNNCKDNFPIMRLPEIYFIIMECGPLDEANTLYEEYCAARNIEYIPLTEMDRKERIMPVSYTHLEAFKEVDLQVLDPDSEGGRQVLLEVCGSFGSGNEYTTIILNKTGYDMFGTFSPWRLPKDEFNRLLKKNEAEMNGQQTDK